MALKKGDRKNFKSLLRAASSGHLALVESTDAKTGEYRALLCAVVFDGSEYVVTPFGHLCTGNPFEDYTDPTLDIDKVEGVK